MKNNRNINVHFVNYRIEAAKELKFTINNKEINFDDVLKQTDNVDHQEMISKILAKYPDSSNFHNRFMNSLIMTSDGVTEADTTGKCIYCWESECNCEYECCCDDECCCEDCYAENIRANLINNCFMQIQWYATNKNYDLISKHLEITKKIIDDLKTNEEK